MTVTTTNVLVGFATLWYAPNLGGTAPEPLPADTVALGSPWGGNWVSPGATEAGLTWSVDAKPVDIYIEEQSNPVLTPIDTSDFMMDATLMEDTVANMALVYGRGAIAATTSPGRSVTDGTTTTGSTTIGSATASFTSADIGRTVTGTGIPAGATIVSITSSTAVVISAAATATASAVALTFGAVTSKQTFTFGDALTQYSFGFEGVNVYGAARRVYIPLGVASGTKVDAAYRRAKAARMYKATFRALCPPDQIEIVEYHN